MKDIATREYDIADGSKAWNLGGSGSHPYVRRIMIIIYFLVGYAVLWMFLHNSPSLEFPAISHNFIADLSKNNDSKVESVLRDSSLHGQNNHSTLESVLREASMENKTVIITTLNDAWAQPGSIFDLFLESFRIGGNQTEKLLNHLVVVSWDQKAYTRCLSLHKHCYQLETKGGNFTSEAFFMTPKYLHMVWRKIEFLGSVLQMGYSFVFTDCDIMWFRDPFRYFYKDGDFQISCDNFNGNSSDIMNLPNSGFSYVKSNERTIWFYKFWFNSSEANLKTQDVLNKIKLDPLVSEKKLKFRFLSTRYFGGFCEPSWDFKKVSTMHANCCVGLKNKINDLRLLLEDWRKYMALSKPEKKRAHPSWSVPQSCRNSFERYGLLPAEGQPNNSTSPLEFPAISHNFIADSSKNNDSKLENVLRDSSLHGQNNHSTLESVLREASMEDKTVIITTLNDAWAQPGSIFDLFLESFRIGGNQTEKLLNHLVVVSWDQKAYTRCLSLHKHCYQLETKGGNFTSEAFFMTPKYLHMVWRKIEFLGSVLQMGYSFVFTDCDIMWFRDPFRYFYKDGDFQISCDNFNGNSSDIMNLPNSGFSYVKSNERTIWFYKFWFNSSEANLKTQDVLNKIKLDPLVSKKKLKFRFLSTRYFGGFCEPSWDFKKVSTMHANCCVGLQNKINDLRLLLEDWRKYIALPKHEKKRAHPSWSVPKSCRNSFERYGLLPAKENLNKSAVGEKPRVLGKKKEHKVKIRT